MSLKEYVAHEMETLEERDLLEVVEYVSFLKFRSRKALGDERLASLYKEFDQEDRELAETGMDDYAKLLSHDSKLGAISAVKLAEVESSVSFALGIMK